MIGQLCTLDRRWDGHGGLWAECLNTTPRWLKAGQIMICVGKMIPNHLFLEHPRRVFGATYFLFYNSNCSRIYMFREEKLHDYIVEV